MTSLAVTLIDVGWGDSVLIESTHNGASLFALVDSNDSVYERSSYLHLKRFFERRGINTGRPAQLFELVVLTHGHADHATGLPLIIRRFGAKRFLYPSSCAPGGISPTLAQIIRYAKHPKTRLGHVQSVDSSYSLSSIPFGAVLLDILWPPMGWSDADENNHSLVLSLTLGSVTFVLTGDATAEVWPHILPRVPSSARVFQVPHHGARNGMFDSAGNRPWLTHFIGQTIQVGASSHTRPHGHPHADVVTELQKAGIELFRTDIHYHVKFETNGVDVIVNHSHV
jgi:beta-lactamase superfamily II metal-dependent hydrolase